MSTKQLVDNIYRMSNDQIIGLAKNNFMPANVQMAIAKHHYRRAHTYLAENAGLDSRVRDYLWTDECNKGYCLKATMISNGHYRDETEKYWELYEKYPGAWTRSNWRMTNALVGGYGWYTRHGEASNTPADLLNKIYDDHFWRSRDERDNNYYYSAPKYTMERMVGHPNCDLPLAIKLSTSGEPPVERRAFEKIVELSK